MLLKADTTTGSMTDFSEMKKIMEFELAFSENNPTDTLDTYFIFCISAINLIVQSDVLFLTSGIS